MLTVNRFSRSGAKLYGVKAIIFHWIANPGTSEKANALFFENRKDGKTGFGSAHFIIGLNGELEECVPTDEVAYHVGSDKKDPASGRIYTDWCREVCGRWLPNWCTIGIELCHQDWSGKFTDATWNKAVELSAKLCKQFNFTVDKIGTHNMIVGWKNCPKWFVDNPKELDRFRNEVENKMKEVL